MFTGRGGFDAIVTSPQNDTVGCQLSRAVASPSGEQPGRRRPPLRSARTIRRRAEGAEHGRFAFVRIGQRVIVVLPKGDIEIGEVGPEDKIMIARRLGPTGFDYAIEVKRSDPPAELRMSD